MNSKVDLHMHSIISDGSETILKLLEKIQNAGITAFAVTDHDAIDGALQMERIVPADIRFIRGVELSCRTDIAKCHILGYRYYAGNQEFFAFVEEAHAVRAEKTKNRFIYLTKELGFVFTAKEVASIKQKKSPTKADFAELLIAKLQKSEPGITKADIFERYFQKLPGGRVDALRAIKAIKAAGGIAVWAHPLGGIGEKRLTEEQFQAQLDLLCSVGLDGLECYYSEYTKEDIKMLCHAAREKGLNISGGSDYHGTNKKHLHLGMLNKEDEPIAIENITVLDLLR